MSDENMFKFSILLDVELLCVELWSSILRDVSLPVMVWHGTRRTDWECGWLEKVPHVRNGIVDGLERCPEEYGLGCGWYPTYGLGM
jgi:hypothetical protein